MKLEVQQNPYCYFITLFKSPGTEVTMKYHRVTKQYQVVKMVGYICKDLYSSDCAFTAKNVFRSWR
jgi:hypothetical protein